MSIVVLDSGPLGLATHPRPRGDAMQCQTWLSELLEAGVRLMVPEVADFEVRRELSRIRSKRGLYRLDAVSDNAEYIAITTAAMRLAAELWADIRQRGLPTAGDNRLDQDVILAAQAMTLNLPNVVIATMNVRHLDRFCDAVLWSDIEPI